MKIGIVKEIKRDEYRVALTPAGARELVQSGHDVLVETGAGDGSAFSDSATVNIGWPFIEASAAAIRAASDPPIKSICKPTVDSPRRILRTVTGRPSTVRPTTTSASSSANASASITPKAIVLLEHLWNQRFAFRYR